MSRTTRAGLTRQTVDIVERGVYRSEGGGTVEIAEAVRDCLASTRFYRPEELERLGREVMARPGEGPPARLEVANETTLAGADRLLGEGAGPVAALNFASARNPGGGFLNGSQAQEESLARSSALYASLLRAPEFYERHRASPSPLYSDAMICSPDCPVIRDDAGSLREEPRRVTFLTAAAPNAGAAATNRPGEVGRIPEVLRRRAGLILALAASRGYRDLVLGAWGCGVFRNDPGVVASAFAGHLRDGGWANRFDRVAFSVLDTSPSLATLGAFRWAFERRG